MKSKYRQALELVISQEAKLAEVKKMHDGAVARERELAEAVQLNEASLKKHEDRLAELELARAPYAQRELEEMKSEIKSLKASVKMLCQESVRGLP
ncbi:hypothetical protein [Pseudomonas frederiksbergensis]|uniref:hypothetical protein n=1 Tax=Pseudomonas frederiksbergensis TaxID=104087 RepID=UPI003D2549F5